MDNSILDNHLISEEAVFQITSEVSKGNPWIAYNTASYFLDTHDVFMFKKEDEANEFAESNISEWDSFKVLDARSLALDDKNLITQKTNFMNQKNFDYLKDQVKFTGFGETLENQLKDMMQKQSPEFSLSHNTKFGSDTTASTLHFKKSDESDMYFFNSYHLSLKREGLPEALGQVFYINKNSSITLKEAYNLMSGRAVNKDLANKEGQLYNAWLQIDFKQTENSGNFKIKQFHQNYGFNLDKELSKHPIKELGMEQDKNRLLDSLRKGNRQSVTFIKNGTEQKHFIEANPQFKTINIYDNNLQRLGSRQSNDEKPVQGEKNATKQEAKNEKQNASNNDDGPAIPKVSKQRAKKQGQSIS